MTTTTTQRFVDAIARLDACVTVDDVRQLLIDAGVTGTPGDCHTCPIARWIAMRTAVEPHLVSIDGGDALLWSYDAIAGFNLRVELETPRAARYFINDFDGLDLDDPDDEVDPDLRVYLPLLDRGTDDDTP